MQLFHHAAMQLSSRSPENRRQRTHSQSSWSTSRWPRLRTSTPSRSLANPACHVHRSTKENAVFWCGFQSGAVEYATVHGIALIRDCFVRPKKVSPSMVENCVVRTAQDQTWHTGLPAMEVNTSDRCGLTHLTRLLQKDQSVLLLRAESSYWLEVFLLLRRPA